MRIIATLDEIVALFLIIGMIIAEVGLSEVYLKVVSSIEYTTLISSSFIRIFALFLFYTFLGHVFLQLSMLSTKIFLDIKNALRNKANGYIGIVNRNKLSNINMNFLGQIDEFSFIFTSLGIILATLISLLLAIFNIINKLIIFLIMISFIILYWLNVTKNADISVKRFFHKNWFRLFFVSYLIFHFARVISINPFAAPGDSYSYGYLALIIQKRGLQEIYNNLSLYGWTNLLCLFPLLTTLSSVVLDTPPLLSLPVLGAMGSVIIAHIGFEFGFKETKLKTVGILLSLLFLSVPLGEMKAPLPTNDLTLGNLQNGSYQRSLPFLFLLSGISLGFSYREARKIEIVSALLTIFSAFLNPRFLLISALYIMVFFLIKYFSRVKSLTTKIILFLLPIISLLLVISPIWNPIVISVLKSANEYRFFYDISYYNILNYFEKNRNLIFYLFLSVMTFILLGIIIIIEILHKHRSRLSEILAPSILYFVTIVFLFLASLNKVIHKWLLFFLYPSETFLIVYPLSLMILMKVFNKVKVYKKILNIFLAFIFLFLLISGGITFPLCYYIKHSGISSLQEYESLSTAFSICCDGTILNEPSWKGMAILLIDIPYDKVVYNYFEWRRSIRGISLNKTGSYYEQVSFRNEELFQIFADYKKDISSQEILELLKKYNISYIILTNSPFVILRRDIGVEIMSKSLTFEVSEVKQLKLIYQNNGIEIYKILYD